MAGWRPRRPGLRRIAVVAFVAWTACSGGGTGAPDAPGDAAADDGGVDVAPPASPDIPWLEAGGPPLAPPALAPCPAGWRETADPESGTAACDPWPATGFEDCTAGDEAHFPGEPGCVRVGTACAADDDWATDLPGDGPIRYVLAGAAPGGDGTRAAPLATIREALEGAAGGTIVAVGKGTYDEVVLLPGGVTLWGACVAETAVASSVPSDLAGTINAWGLDGEVRNLRVEGERIGVSATARGRAVVLRDVIIAGTQRLGFEAIDGGSVTGEGLVVRDARAVTADGLWGRGADVTDRATVEIRRGVFEGNRELGIFVSGEGTTLRLEDTVVRETRSRASDRLAGRGLQVGVGATVELGRVVFERNRDVAIGVSGAAATVTLRDVVVRDTLSQESDGNVGRGLQVSEGAAVEARRCLFAGSLESAIVAFHADTTLALEDVVVRDTSGTESLRLLGLGLVVGEGATATVRRAVFERNRSLTVQATGAETAATLEDVVVRATRSQASDRRYGMGLAAGAGAVVDLRRALFEANRSLAILAVDAGTRLTLQDAVIRDTGSQESDGRGGAALHGGAGASVEVWRGLFERNREATILASHPGSLVTLEDVVVRDTLERACARDTCADFGAGIGLASYGGAHLDAVRFAVTRSAMCGVQLAYGVGESGPMAEGGTMDLHDGEVSFNVVCGANIQTEWFDFTRLMDNVRYHDNGTDLDTSALPVPDVVFPSVE